MGPADRIREIVPPEGVPLEVAVARAGDRAAAFLLDAILQAAALFLLVFALNWIGGRDDWSAALAMVMAFCVRTFYFMWFETRWQGRTPGKKRGRIRVIDAAGGALRAEAIVARNLMRELEIWIPISLLVAPDQIWPGAPGWAAVAFSVWGLAFLLMPLFNRDRLRAGDIVAGTRVVAEPDARLQPDLGGAEISRRAEQPMYAFTNRQLDVYGIYELQVLEDVLRGTAPGRRQAMRAVCEQIAKKISWTGPEPRAERFLREFYTALRARLEHKMLLGRRKADKFAEDPPG